MYRLLFSRPFFLFIFYQIIIKKKKPKCFIHGFWSSWNSVQIFKQFSIVIFVLEIIEPDEPDVHFSNSLNEPSLKQRCNCFPFSHCLFFMKYLKKLSSLMQSTLYIRNNTSIHIDNKHLYLRKKKIETLWKVFLLTIALKQ